MRLLSGLKIMPWPPLIRPPVAGSEVPEVPAGPLKALTCRNSVVSLAMLVRSEANVHARIVFSDMVFGAASIPGNALSARLIGAISTPEAGPVMEVLSDVDIFTAYVTAALYITARIPKGIPAGLYKGKVAVVVNGEEAASNEIEIEVADVDLPDVHDWEFFLNVWANPGAVARRYGVEMWSDEHFARMRSYIEDLASHGQKTAVVPICYQPWGTQTRDPYPNAVIWKRRGAEYEFDFSIFGRYVEMHEACGIDRAIHCYSVVQGPGSRRDSMIEYVDIETGETKKIQTEIGDAEWQKAWRAFFAAFREYLGPKGWLKKTYIAFDEKPDNVMNPVMEMLAECAPDLKIALAADTRSEAFAEIADLCLSGSFSDRGIAEVAPAERKMNGMVELLDPENSCAISKCCPDKTITTFYVCCGPAFPNTFVYSPLVESRMLAWLAAQGGYDGFLRWSYNDWPDEPYLHPEYAPFPTGDCNFVYPGPNGPVSSLRWEQLREGIQDYELALMAASKMNGPEGMVDFEQAMTLACRNPNGREKAVGDIELARRLLIPMAEG